MSTMFPPLAIISAFWCDRTTRKRRLQNSPSTVAANIVKCGFAAAPTRAFVAQFGTSVIPTLQRTSALPGADMFGFEPFVDQT